VFLTCRRFADEAWVVLIRVRFALGHRGCYHTNEWQNTLVFRSLFHSPRDLLQEASLENCCLFKVWRSVAQAQTDTVHPVADLDNSGGGDDFSLSEGNEMERDSDWIFTKTTCKPERGCYIIYRICVWMLCFLRGDESISGIFLLSKSNKKWLWHLAP